MINLIDWADYLTVAVFAKAATYLAIAIAFRKIEAQAYIMMAGAKGPRHDAVLP